MCFPFIPTLVVVYYKVCILIHDQEWPLYVQVTMVLFEAFLIKYKVLGPRLCFQSIAISCKGKTPNESVFEVYNAHRGGVRMMQ